MVGVSRIFLVVALAAVAFVVAPGTGTAQTPVEPTTRKPIVVAGEPIPLKSLRRWQRIAALSLGEGRRWRAAQYRVYATQILIDRRWVEYEARDMKIAVSRAEVRSAYRRQRRAQFPRSGDWTRYLRRTGLTSRDVQAAVRVDLLQRRIGDRVTAGATDQADAQRRLLEYRGQRQARWQPRTLCHARWKIQDWCAS